MYHPDGQYISITRESNNLNIEYQKLKNKNIDQTNRSTFLIGDSDFMSEDVLFKIQSLQKSIPHTYLTTFIEDETQYIIPKDQVVEDHYLAKKLNDEINIAVDKNKIFEQTHFFDKTGIDYIFSPFSVLHEHNIQNPESNALIVLIYNNKIYALAVDGFAKIIFSKVLCITEFDDIQNSDFYDDQVMKQKLYDEVYQLELTSHLKTIMSEFYQGEFDIFIEKINILYTVKQLQREQITKIQNELMLKIDYHPISMDEIVFEMIKTKPLEEYNFSTPRDIKGASKQQSSMIVFSIIVVLAAIVYLIQSNPQTRIDLPFLFSKNVEVKEDIVETKEIKPIVNVDQNITLPNHLEKNMVVSILTTSLLDMIPYDMVLHKLEILKDSSTMEASLITKDLFAKSLKTDLLKLYKKSEIELKEQNSKTEFNATITNNDLIDLNISNSLKPDYSKELFLTQAQISEVLKNQLPKNGNLKFNSLFKFELITFNYNVVLKDTTPKQFIEIIDKLNKLKNSIHVNYPIVFEKKDDGLEINFNLQVHQYK